jgi:fumarylpyruvate hydrolase
MKQIQNIFCVGRNYRLHAAELGNDVPTSPMLFGKPTHSLVETAGQEIEFPGNRGEIHYEVELVIHMARAYEPGLKLEQLVDSVALGVDLTLRDVQSTLKKSGHPWLLAKGFKNAAILTPFHPFPGEQELAQTDFCMLKNGEQVQRGNIRDMIFDLMTIIQFTAENFGLDAGDVIYTGTPAGVGPVLDGDQFTLLMGEDKWGEFTARLR